MNQQKLDERLEYIKGKVQPVQGWTFDDAGVALYKLANFYSPNGTVVELGNWKGKSTLWLGYGIEDRMDKGKVYAINTWEESPDEDNHRAFLKDYNENQLYEEFSQNIHDNSLDHIVIPIRGDTANVSKQWNLDLKIGLLHIDASHEYEAVRRDFEFWSPYVMNQGIIVFDDVPS